MKRRSPAVDALIQIRVSASSVAERAGVSYDTIRSYRMGRRKPTRATMDALAKAVEAEAARLIQLATEIRRAA